MLSVFHYSMIELLLLPAVQCFFFPILFFLLSPPFISQSLFLYTYSTMKLGRAVALAILKIPRDSSSS